MALDENLARVCPVCGHAIAAPVFCRRCETPHHAECWQFFGQCATFACGGTETTTTAPPPAALVRVTGSEVTAPVGAADQALSTDTRTQEHAWVRLGLVEGQRELMRLVTAFNAAGIPFRLDTLDSAGLPTEQSLLGRRTQILIPYQEVSDARALVLSEDLRVLAQPIPSPGELVNYPKLLALFLVLAVVFPQWLAYFGLGAIAAVCGRDIARSLGVRAGP